MEERIERFFRHCPACGRRFEIHLVGKKLEDEKTTETTVMPTPLLLGRMSSGSNINPFLQPGGYIVLKESLEPTRIDVKDFDYTYKCGHCGHIWHELKTE
jgi:hypothetical protein